MLLSKSIRKAYENFISSEEGLKLVQSDGSSPISKCQIPGLDYVVFVNGSGPHRIEYDFGLENPPKEVLVSRKCAEAVVRGAQVYVPRLLACTAHVEKEDMVAVCVAIEQPGDEGDWSVNMTRGTTLQGLPTGKIQNCSFLLWSLLDIWRNISYGWPRLLFDCNSSAKNSL